MTTSTIRKNHVYRRREDGELVEFVPEHPGEYAYFLTAEEDGPAMLENYDDATGEWNLVGVFPNRALAIDRMRIGW